MEQKKATKKKMTDERICKDFINKHGVGSKVNGITIFDIARDNEGNKYVIVPLHEFAKYMDKTEGA